MLYSSFAEYKYSNVQDTFRKNYYKIVGELDLPLDIFVVRKKTIAKIKTLLLCKSKLYWYFIYYF